jgi:hypothetical protein
LRARHTQEFFQAYDAGKPASGGLAKVPAGLRVALGTDDLAKQAAGGISRKT